MVDHLDTHILVEVRAGKPRAFGQLIDRYKDKAMTLSFRLLGDRREAEEAVQDAFVNAFRRLDQFRENSGFGTWYYRILYNVCMTRLRKRQTAIRYATLTQEDSEICADTDNPLEDIIERGDLQSIVSEELANLPEQYRAALTLFYVQDLKYEQIVEVMEIPLGTVKTFLFRGKTMLRKRLQRRLWSEVHVA